ncbi:hypothetical protein F4780DRAFT_629576 [Xylariomycetidae sp. FL0641]|nr:hypothetical protein F4780DRAFT_629576 [Xylariomycetidae sp. FL0641]
MSNLKRFKEPWIDSIRSRPSVAITDFPAFPVSEPESLVTTSCPLSFEIGIGADIYNRSLLPAIFDAKHEIILVTCFWAPSYTLNALKGVLDELAAVRAAKLQRQRELGPEEEPMSTLKIRICFSSRSFFQKLFHTSSRDGYTYPPSSWATTLGLPDQATMQSGLIDLQVKSLFFLPFSVMHPKFLIVDRKTAWLPSCNVSWEPWLEGCIAFTGEAVTGLLRFYWDVWENEADRAERLRERFAGTDAQSDLGGRAPARPRTIAHIGLTSSRPLSKLFVQLDEREVPTVLLPSSHHRSPNFKPLPWHYDPTPPSTPLNSAIIRLLDMAEKSVYIQTPNLTSATLIDALLRTLERGVEVTIVTCTGMMVLEQLITAGTTTSFCVRSLIRRYQELQRHAPEGPEGNNGSARPFVDLEAQHPGLGGLKISYFRPLAASDDPLFSETPVQSHLKLTIIDSQYTILGSGNMDRASWFTSQELGMLFQSADIAATVKGVVDKALVDRLKPVFDSVSQSEVSFGASTG